MNSPFPTPSFSVYIYLHFFPKNVIHLIIKYPLVISPRSETNKKNVTLPNEANGRVEKGKTGLEGLMTSHTWPVTVRPWASH